MCGMIHRTATNSLNSDNSEHNLFVVCQELQFEILFRYILCLQWGGGRFLTLSLFSFGDYFVVYFMSFNRNFSHSSHGCVSVVLYLPFILRYFGLHRQRTFVLLNEE